MAHYFITGTSSGIGKALSIALASEGHVVSAVGRRIEHLKKIKNKHKNINIFRADVCDRLEIKNAIERSIKSGGNIDCAVLNAGKYLALYIDLTPLGIKVQIISPGFVETEATAINDFKMPQIISASEAAYNIVKGLKSNKFEIGFPTGFVIIMKLLRILPKSIYFKVIRWITNR